MNLYSAPNPIVFGRPSMTVSTWRPMHLLRVTYLLMTRPQDCFLALEQAGIICGIRAVMTREPAFFPICPQTPSSTANMARWRYTATSHLLTRRTSHIRHWRRANRRQTRLAMQGDPPTLRKMSTLEYKLHPPTSSLT